jgi:aspartyl/glutamyl-tRNA(Asn/Gln) amidotransferase C subunit
MTRISREELLKLAKAANLHLSEEEMPVLVERLGAVLSYAEYLVEVAAQHKEVSLPQQSNVMRDDVVIPTPAEPLLSLAPAREENFFVVPVILKQ